MTNGIRTRDSKILIGTIGTLLLASVIAFAGTLIPIAELPDRSRDLLVRYLDADLQPNLVLTSTNGTWIGDSSGTQNWSDSTKWSGGAIADGAGATADFSMLNITGSRDVTLDSARTVGVLNIGDT